MLIESWIRRRVPYVTIAARLRERGETIYHSSLTAHKRHAGLVPVEAYQLRP